VTELEPDLPQDYANTLAELKDAVHAAQVRAQLVINAAMIEVYWSIGQTISPAATGRTLGE
jgi:hypothetical protein